MSGMAEETNLNCFQDQQDVSTPIAIGIMICFVQPKKALLSSKRLVDQQTVYHIYTLKNSPTLPKYSLPCIDFLSPAQQLPTNLSNTYTCICFHSYRAPLLLSQQYRGQRTVNGTLNQLIYHIQFQFQCTHVHTYVYSSCADVQLAEQLPPVTNTQSRSHRTPH